jgi:hypothetical protein
LTSGLAGRGVEVGDGLGGNPFAFELRGEFLGTRDGPIPDPDPL